MKIAYVWALTYMLFGASCRTFKNDTCPKISEASVSNCRAELKCQLKKKTSYNLGFRTSAQYIENYGLKIQQNPVSDNFFDCVNRDLEEQRATTLIINTESKNAQ